MNNDDEEMTPKNTLMDSFINNINDNNKEQIIQEFKFGYFFKNFLSRNDYLKLHNIILGILKSETISNGVAMNYFHTSTGADLPYFNGHWSYYVTNVPFFSEYMLSLIRNISPSFKNLECKRIYISFQGAGISGNWHYDDHMEGSYTFTLYLNMGASAEVSKLEADGTYNKFYTLNDKYKEIKKNNIDSLHLQKHDYYGYFRIKYKDEPVVFLKTQNNTAAIFDSTALHLGDGLKCNSNRLRCCVSFKLQNLTPIKNN